MIQPWKLGPGLVDFSPLGQVGQTLGSAIEKGAQRQTLAALGQDIQSGNYDGAAQRAFSAGDAQTGLGLLKLGQGAADRQADQALLGQMFGGAGASPRPGGTAQGGAPAAPAVAVANSEDEVRRLEGSAGNTGQRVAARLVQNGLSPAAAAGIVSNLGAESSFNTGARNRGESRHAGHGQGTLAAGVDRQAVRVSGRR